MANKFKLKRSSVANKVPLAADLDLGELAINTTDGKLYLKRNVSGTETVIEVGKDAVTATQLAPALISTGSGASNSGKWTKIASMSITARYGDGTAVLHGLTVASGDSLSRHMEISFRVKQQLPYGGNPYVEMLVVGDNTPNWTGGYVIVSNAGPTVVDFYVRADNSYAALRAATIYQGMNNGTLTFHSSQPFVAAGDLTGLVISNKRTRYSDLDGQTSSQDSTAGRLMKVGAFGVGAMAGNSISNFAAANPSGIYSGVSNTVANGPNVGGVVQGFTAVCMTYANDRLYHVTFANLGSWSGWYQQATGNVTWTRSYDTSYKPNAADVGALASGGTAVSATKLATARTISVTGDATWSTSFDGSANATGALTLANSGVTAGTYPKVTVDAKGRVTAGAALAAADVPALPISKTTGLQTALDNKGNKPYVIAVVGDSIGMETIMYGDSWCTKLERYLNTYPGRQVVVRNLSIGGATFKAANTEAFFGTKTIAQAVVACAPDMVITMLGANDAVTQRRFGGAPESLSALKGYADTYFNYLRASLPSARLILAKEILYDRTHASLASLKNREVIPFFWNTVTNNAYPEHWLLSAAYRESHSVDPSHLPDFVMLNDLYAYIEGKPYLNYAIDMDYYRMSRIGGMGADTLHPNEFGKMVVATYIKTGILSLALPEFADKTDLGTIPHLMSWDNADSLFGLLVESDGAKWVNRTVVEGELFDLMEGAPGRWNLSLWMMRFRASFNFDRYDCGVGDTVYLSISNAKKRTPVFGSVNDSGWSASPLATTDDNGCAFISYTPTSTGVKTLYYKTDYDVYGPFSINVSATSEPLDGGAY